MSQKLTELKKQAAEIAEQIKKLEAESPEENIRSAIFASLGVASVKPVGGRYVDVFDPHKITDEIMEAVNEYVAVRIAELEKQLAEKDEQLINVSAELDAVRSDRDVLERAQAKFSDAVLTEEIEKETLKTTGRPAIEYLKEFPEPYRTAALKAVEERPKQLSAIVSNAADALVCSFDWADGTYKWPRLHGALLTGTQWPAAELFID